jgi:DNA-binding response OmpR family regulator
MPKGKKVLIVDDDPDIQLSCRIVLEQAGYTVISASSSVEGMKQVDAERPDVVLLDIMMEAADSGLQTAGWMAQHHPKTPVMVLSSIADAAGLVFDTSSLPVADMVNKPIAPDELLAKVGRMLAKAGS